MKFYFTLQIRRIRRYLTDAGISPVVALLLIVLVFLGFSVYLFDKTEFAEWAYCLIAVVILLQFSDVERQEQLKQLFKKKHLQIRLLENGGLVLPFLPFLLYEGKFLAASILLVLAAGLAVLSGRFRLNFTIPTPFKRMPFEFPVGFRKSFLMFVFAGVVLFQAAQVDNFNLGLFALALVFLTGMYYFLKPEHLFFVWIYNVRGKRFLWRKSLTAIKGISILSAPYLVLLFVLFPDNWLYILGAQILGYFFIVSIIFAKYSAFPHEMNVPQALLYSLCLWFPPMLAVVVPIFFVQSLRRLKPILE